MSKYGIKKCFSAFLSDVMQRNCGRKYGEQFGALTLTMQNNSIICHSDNAEIPMLCNVVCIGAIWCNAKTVPLSQICAASVLVSIEGGVKICTTSGWEFHIHLQDKFDAYKKNMRLRLLAFFSIYFASIRTVQVPKQYLMIKGDWILVFLLCVCVEHTINENMQQYRPLYMASHFPVRSTFGLCPQIIPLGGKDCTLL